MYIMFPLLCPLDNTLVKVKRVENDFYFNFYPYYYITINKLGSRIFFQKYPFIYKEGRG